MFASPSPVQVHCAQQESFLRSSKAPAKPKQRDCLQASDVDYLKVGGVEGHR
jgi:hypothetical protein